MKVEKVSDRKILRIDHVSLAVNDYEEAVKFFTKILGATSQSNGAEGGALEYYWEIFALGDLSRFQIGQLYFCCQTISHFIKMIGFNPFPPV